MNPTHAHADPAPAAAERPPHPFRASPWYDPTERHQPCACPECEAKRASKARPWKLKARIGLVVFGGVLLPIASVIVNHLLGGQGEQVVQLGVSGTAAIALSVLTTLAHLIFSPVKQDLATGQPVHRPPASPAARFALLAASLLGCLTWGYLAILFLPLLPISFIAVIFIGIGLCGLCPYGALAIHVIQARRGYRSLVGGGRTLRSASPSTPLDAADGVARRSRATSTLPPRSLPDGAQSRTRLGPAMRDTLPRARFRRGPVLAFTLACLLAPPVALAGVGISNHVSRARLNTRIDLIGALAPHSVARMQAFAALRGLEGHLVDRYMLSHTTDEQALLAEAHLRLTDAPIHDAVQARFARGSRALIKPFWFLNGTEPMQHTRFWRF